MQGEGEYVLGLEPANCLAGGRNKERDDGRLEMLESFETKEIEITIDLKDLKQLHLHFYIYFAIKYIRIFRIV